MGISRLAPAHRWWFIVLSCAVLVIATFVFSLSQPVLSILPQAGDSLSSSAGSLTLEEGDFSLEPGDLPTYLKFNHFMDRQDLLINILKGTELNITKQEQLHEVVLSRRTVLDLPLAFWIQLLVAIGSLLIAGGIWVLKPEELGPRFFLLSAVALVFSSLASAIYTTRTLAIPSDIFRGLVAVNSSGATGFGIFMVALFTVYPFKFRYWKPLFTLSFVVFSIWTALFLLQIVSEKMLGMGGIILVLMTLILVAIGGQFFKTRKDPKNKAILLWIGLSVVLGSGGFVAVNIVPLTLGLEPWDQGYAFFSFLLIYLGIAAGLKQYRLFEVGQWAYRVGFYALGATLIVVADALLITFGMGRLPALGITLLLVGFLYLPLRDTLWRWFNAKKELPIHHLLESSLHIALAPSAQQRIQRWHALLKQNFDPLEFSVESDLVIDQVSLSSDGTVMLLPGVAGSSGIRMSYPFAGKTLFSPSALQTAQSLVTFIAQAESNRAAYDRGVSEERLRIAQDLHDNVGARLLSGLHTEQVDIKSTIREAISDIRTIVQGITGESSSLVDLMADLRSDSQRRLQAVQIEMHWPLEGYVHSAQAIDYRLHKTMASCVREVVSNTIKHSQAKKFQVLVSLGVADIRVELSDDGIGLPQNVESLSSQGFGLRSMEKRVKDLQGHFAVSSSNQGMKIILCLPIS